MVIDLQTERERRKLERYANPEHREIFEAFCAGVILLLSLCFAAWLLSPPN